MLNVNNVTDKSVRINQPNRGIAKANVEGSETVSFSLAIAQKLKGHLTNCDQVDEALKYEPDNEDLQKLRTDLLEVIRLAAKELLGSEKSADDAIASTPTSGITKHGCSSAGAELETGDLELQTQSLPQPHKERQELHERTPILQALGLAEATISTSAGACKIIKTEPLDLDLHLSSVHEPISDEEQDVDYNERIVKKETENDQIKDGVGFNKPDSSITKKISSNSPQPPLIGKSSQQPHEQLGAPEETEQKILHFQRCDRGLRTVNSEWEASAAKRSRYDSTNQDQEVKLEEEYELELHHHAGAEDGWELDEDDTKTELPNKRKIKTSSRNPNGTLKGRYFPKSADVNIERRADEDLRNRLIRRLETNVAPFEPETDPGVIARRTKQIEYGKNTPEYFNYVHAVPKHDRQSWHPKTPNMHRKYSRRAWDGMVKQWRINLHCWGEHP